jgi:hypothetical protein
MGRLAASSTETTDKQQSLFLFRFPGGRVLLSAPPRSAHFHAETSERSGCSANALPPPTAAAMIEGSVLSFERKKPIDVYGQASRLAGQWLFRGERTSTFLC